MPRICFNIASLSRRLRSSLATTVLLGPVFIQHVCAAQQIDGDHVRTSEPLLRAAMARGVEQSSLLRHLVAQLDASDVIVYIASDCQMPSSLVGRLTFMSSVAGRRYLMVRIGCMLSQWREIATLGHELRHALEIADAKWVVDDASLAELYERTGFASSVLRAGAGYDSQMAIETGRRVWDELSGDAE